MAGDARTVCPRNHHGDQTSKAHQPLTRKVTYPKPCLPDRAAQHRHQPPGKGGGKSKAERHSSSLAALGSPPHGTGSSLAAAASFWSLPGRLNTLGTGAPAPGMASSAPLSWGERLTVNCTFCNPLDVTFLSIQNIYSNVLTPFCTNCMPCATCASLSTFLHIYGSCFPAALHTWVGFD